MAYQVVVSPLVGVVFDKLKSLIQNKFGESWGVQKEMKKLFKTLSSIKDVLNDAEEKQVGDMGIHQWLEELKDAAYKAEDVLEEWAFRDQQLAPEKVTDSLKELMESFDELAEDMVKFRLQRGMVQKIPEISPDRETGSLLSEPKVYGREKDEQELVKLLLDQCPPHRSRHPSGQRRSQDQVNSQEDIFVCSIVGMGGIGKTTLAQLVYNNTLVVKHFQSRAWVCVSDTFDVKHLIKSIIVSVSPNPCTLEALAPLQQHLQKVLRGKRFLLVLDDVWDDNQDKWNKLKVSLACGAKGSCAIVTTRLKTVASVAAGTCPPHDLKVLSNKACWRLFKQRAFGLDNAQTPSLVEIGKQIVAKCGGVPLAAKALGGLLRFENKESKWSSIRDSEIWELPQYGENDILPVLTLSYNHLSPVLKQCFAYCSIFPKDHDLNIKDLIYLWMANGLVQPKGKIDLEDAGDEIFRALLWRSMFQEIKKDKDGDMVTCKMHDLLHDLACYMATNESYTLDVENVDAENAGNITNRTRHVSILGGNLSPLVPGYIQTSSQCLHSLILLKFWQITVEESVIFFFFGLMRLRALDLHNCNIEMVPDCIGQMIHLRYLNLSQNPMRSLPKRICGLNQLQTLKLNHCARLQSLQDMSKMINLRHLEIQGCEELQQAPINIGKLVCLHTLSSFIVGLENGCSIKELQGLNHLGGHLRIEKLENVKNAVESKEANLRSKQNLRSLELWWSGDKEEVQENMSDEEVQENWWSGDKEEVQENLSDEEVQENVNEEVQENVSDDEEVQENVSDEEVQENVNEEVQENESDDEEVQENVSDEEVQENVIEVTEGLQPHSNLRRFFVRGYQGVSYPSWLTVAFLPNLVEIALSECRRCTSLPPLGKLTFLKVLKMHSMDSLKFIDDEVYGESEAQGFQSLEELCLDCMPNLEGWSSSVEAAGATTQQILLPCLKTSTLKTCPKLKGRIPLSSTLGSLSMYKCNETILGYVRDLPGLSQLRIVNFDELVSFPEGDRVSLRNLPSLETLFIASCPSLEHLPELNLLSLKTLHITICRNLKRLPKLNKTCLERLLIRDCLELKLSNEDFEELVVLKTLQLDLVPSMMKGGFPEGLKHATMLNSLTILCCTNNGVDFPEWIDHFMHHLCLENEGFSTEEQYEMDWTDWIDTPLYDMWIESKEENEMDLPEWIGTLTSLKYLEIEGCKNRNMLPEGLQNLTDLEELQIYGCNEELESRCEKDNGEDWFKIAHVPEVIITSEPSPLSFSSSFITG